MIPFASAVAAASLLSPDATSSAISVSSWPVTEPLSASLAHRPAAPSAEGRYPRCTATLTFEAL